MLNDVDRMTDLVLTTEIDHGDHSDTTSMVGCVMQANDPIQPTTGKPPIHVVTAHPLELAELLGLHSKTSVAFFANDSPPHAQRPPCSH